MRIKVLFWGSVEDMAKKELVVEEDVDVHIIPFPFIEGLRGDYVLVIAIYYDNNNGNTTTYCVDEYEENDA